MTRILDKARSYLAKFGPGYLWFRHAGQEYVVRDGRVLSQVRAVVKDEGETAVHDGQLDAQDQELERHQRRLDLHEAEIEQWEDAADPSELSNAKERLKARSILEKGCGREMFNGDCHH